MRKGVFKMKILVTGGAGFIGSNFISYLIENTNDSVVNLDKLTYAGNLENLKSFEKNQKYSFVEGDICDKSILDCAIQGFKIEGIVNFAAESHVDRSINSAKEFVKTNVEGTLNLLESARDNEIERFLQISTDEVYGSAEKESFDESMLLHPRNPYAASKAAADMLCISFFETYNLPIIVTRSTNNFGRFQYPEKFLPLMITNLLEGKKIPVYGTGENIRDWLFVEDNCKAIDFVFRKGKEGEFYNIAGKNELRNIDLAKKVLNLMNESEEKLEFVQDRKGHDLRYSIDNSKLEELGFKINNNFDNSLEETINWYKNNESWWKTIKNDKKFKNWQEKNYNTK